MSSRKIRKEKSPGSSSGAEVSVSGYAVSSVWFMEQSLEFPRKSNALGHCVETGKDLIF